MDFQTACANLTCVSVRKCIIAVASAVLALAVVLAVLLVVKPQETASTAWSPPIPNGYDTFVEASAGLQWSTLRPGNNLRGYISSNTEAFRLFKRGLSEQTRVPALPVNIQVLGLAIAVNLEAKAAEERSDWSSAALIYLDLIQYGLALQRGDLKALVSGLSREKSGIDGLSNVITKLPSVEQATCRQRTRELNQSRISFEEVLNYDDFILRELSANLFQYLWYKHLPSSYKTRARVKAAYERNKWALGKFAEESAPGNKESGERRPP